MGIPSQEAVNEFLALMEEVDEPLKRTFQVSVGSVNKSMLYCIFYFAYLLFKIIVLLPVKIGC